MTNSKISKFDLRSLQRDNDTLPSLADLQSGCTLPSLVDIQSDRPELPSLKTFQSDENVYCEEDESEKDPGRPAQSRHRARRGRHLRLMRAHRSLETEDDHLGGEIEISDSSKGSLKNMRELSKSMEQTNP